MLRARWAASSPAAVTLRQPPSASGQMVLDLLLELNREQGATLVLVTHELSVAQLADRRVRLRDGLVVSE